MRKAVRHYAGHGHSRFRAPHPAWHRPKEGGWPGDPLRPKSREIISSDNRQTFFPNRQIPPGKSREKLSLFFWRRPVLQSLVQELAPAQDFPMNTTISQPKPVQQVPATTAALALIPLGVLINLGIGTIVHLLKLPVFIDAV